MNAHNIEKNVEKIFRKNKIENFSSVALSILPIEKQIRDIFGELKSIYIFYIPYSKALLNLKIKRVFLLKNHGNNQYIESIFIRYLKILFVEIERISLSISNYLESFGYESMPIPVRCIPGEEDKLPFSLVRIAEYIGLGSVGENKCLITPNYGPRIIIGSIVTSFICENNEHKQINPCIHCFKCADICPTGALTKAREKIYLWNKCNMCSLCEIVCPIGQSKEKN